MANINGTSGSPNLFVRFLVWNAAWLLLAAFAVFLGWRGYRLSTEGEVVTAVVVRWVEEDTSAYFTDIYPVVEFQVNGETYSVRSQNNYRWWNKYTRFPLGGEVEMRYDPASPETAEINSWIDLWGESIILALLTIVCAVGVNVYLFMLWRRRRAAQPAV